MGISFTQVGFLIPGNFSEDDPLTGLEQTLDIIAPGEALGYDSAWVRQRHLERGVSSAATFLAAATQRTHRIGLGTAVIPLGYENPFRLAEDLATPALTAGSGRLCRRPRDCSSCRWARSPRGSAAGTAGGAGSGQGRHPL